LITNNPDPIQHMAMTYSSQKSSDDSASDSVQPYVSLAAFECVAAAMATGVSAGTTSTSPSSLGLINGFASSFSSRTRRDSRCHEKSLPTHIKT
jgi:hypothetical protein